MIISVLSVVLMAGAGLVQGAGTPGVDEPVGGPLERAERLPLETPYVHALGLSVQGRPITATLLGDPAGSPVMAIAGIHGNEQGTTILARELRDSTQIPPGLAVWVIEGANPDGLAANTRTNSRGVDLNRNFNTNDWLLVGVGTRYYSGEYAASEPETRALQDFIAMVRPELLVWWHQVGNHVDQQLTVANYGLLEHYASRANVPIRYTSCGTPCVGNATVFTNQTFPGLSSFVVELPAYISTAGSTNHVAAFLSTARQT